MHRVPLNSGGRVDTVAFRQAYENLLSSLVQKKFDAHKLAAEVSTSLNGSYSNEFQLIMDAVEALDFPIAERHLEALSARVESKTA